MRKTTISICVIASFFVLAGATLAGATETSYVPLAPLPGTTLDVSGTSTNMSTYLSGMIKLLIALGAVTSILVAIVGGTQYVASGIAPSAKDDAKGRIQNAFIGLALILASYLILNSISPNLVQFNFNLPKIGVLPGTGTADVSVGGVTAIGPVVSGTGAPSHSVLSGGGANPGISAPSSTALPTDSLATGGLQTSGINTPGTEFVVGAPTSGAAVSGSYTSELGAVVQETFNISIDLSNDHSIITHCLGNIFEPICNKTDLNNDGITNTADVVLFVTKGVIFDVNSNKTLELENSVPTMAKSCFYKISTANIRDILPGVYFDSDGGVHQVCSGAKALTSPPGGLCAGQENGWLRFNQMAGVCAADAGHLSMPFGFVYLANGMYPGAAGSDGQYSNFINWVTSANSGLRINLASLFVKTFLSSPPPPCSDSCGQHDPYFESNLGKITYTTIAQYDLNNDGISDFNASGADMSIFDGCKVSTSASICAQADFNSDGVIDDRDLGFTKTIVRDVLSGISFIPLGWKLDWHESMLFDQDKYKDKQIINYCIGRKAFGTCGASDVDQDPLHTVDNADLAAFETLAPTLDFNSDGIVNLTSY